MNRSRASDDRGHPAVVTTLDGRTLTCQGAWTMPDVASAERVLNEMSWPAGGAMILEGSGIQAFDTGGAVVLYRALLEARRRGCEVSIEGLRSEYDQLMKLVSSNWNAIVAEVAPRPDGSERLKSAVRNHFDHVIRGVEFIGDSSTALWMAAERYALEPYMRTPGISWRWQAATRAAARGTGWSG